MTHFHHSDLEIFCEKIFLKLGCPLTEARQAAKVLIAADLRGIDSHGVARLSGYVRLHAAGRLNPKPNIKIIYQTPGTATIDGDAGLGLVIGPKVMEIIMEKADKVGTGWAAVQNANHFGIAGYHAIQALEREMIGIAMTNASPLVAPTFSKERMLGTNPIAVAIPAGKELPFVADFSTTTVANGKIEILQRRAEQAPEGWLQDVYGNPTTNVNALKTGGALLPLGSDSLHSSHKGYCLGAIVDILSGVLSGANYGPWTPPFVTFLPLAEAAVGKGIGHFFGAMRVDAFQPATAFKQQMDKWIQRFRKATPIDEKQRVYIPGEPEHIATLARKKDGINLLDPVYKDLLDLAGRFNVPLL